ncbi:hypothetical protein LDL77_10380 [Flagellimonas marinaquae]|uniref:hypothetical protein n=1 Tax=Flagellimonas aurea TaxID=2915619 RepID=UPI001CE2017A|nr:hypothetical protein LDL77_10380 [Allomuricauda aquimarina]
MKSIKPFLKPLFVCFVFLLLSCSNDDNGSEIEDEIEDVDDVGDDDDDNDDDGGEITVGTLVTLSPSNNEKPVSKTPTIAWEEYDGEQTVTYSVFLGTSEDGLTEFASGLDMPTFDIEETDPLELNTDYYWRVIAVEDGTTLAESEVQLFTTEAIFATLITEDAAYGSRKGTAVEVFNEKIWLIGGRDETDTPLPDIWSSADGENWTFEGNLSFGAIYGHELIAFNGKLWIYGGSSEGILSNKIFSSEDGITWVEETETTPFIQYQSSKFTVLGDKIFRIAGYSGSIEDLSPERNVYSSTDGLNWVLETENHGFESKYRFQIESLNDILYCIEPNPDSDIESISTRTSTDGANWSAPVVSGIRERGINSVRTIVLDNTIILMTTPEDGPNSYSTFYISPNGEDWELATTIDSFPIQAIFFTLVNLNGELLAIGGTQRSNFSSTDNTVWKLN